MSDPEFDPRCYDLADVIMQDQAPKLQNARNVTALAKAIQHAIDDFLEGLKQ